MNKKFWCDLKTDKEKAEFIRCGRAIEAGIIAPAIADEVANAFEAKAVATSAYKQNTTVSWAKNNLKILADMMEDRGMDWFATETRRIMDGLRCLDT